MIEKPRLLLIEDQAPILRELKELFSELPQKWQDLCGIPGFHVATAWTQLGARALLEQATTTGLRYDVLLFDLGLPFSETDPTGSEDSKSGIELLNRYAESACHSVVVITGRPVTESVVEQLISPLIDGFSSKSSWDHKREVVFAAVAKAFFAGQKRLWKASTEHREQNRLRIHACTLSADRLLTRISPTLQETLDGIHAVSAMLRDRFDIRIEQDAADPLCCKLRDLSRQITDSVAAIASDRLSIGSGAEELTRFSFRDCVESALHRLRSGFYTHRVLVDFFFADECFVESFRTDLESVIEEVVLGIIFTSLPRSVLRIGISTDGDTVTLAIANESPQAGSDVGCIAETNVQDRPSENGGSGMEIAKGLARNLPGVSLLFESSADSNAATLCIRVRDDGTNSNH